MTPQEVLNWLDRNERKVESRWPTPFKLKIIKKIQAEYNQTSLAISQSDASRQMMDHINQLPDWTELPGFESPRAITMAVEEANSHVEATWTLLIDYLKDNQNYRRTLHKAAKDTLEKIILDVDVSARYKMGHVSGVTLHRLKIIGNGVDTAHMLGQRMAYRGNNQPSPFTSCFFSLCLLPGVLGDAFYHAFARKPLGIAQQQTFLEENLTKEFREQSKIDIINEILKLHPLIDRTKSLFFFGQISPESDNLCRLLADPRNLLPLKWEAIKEYVRTRDGDTLKNNGKKLFNCIEKLVNEYASREEARTATMAPQ